MCLLFKVIVSFLSSLVTALGSVTLDLTCSWVSTPIVWESLREACMMSMQGSLSPCQDSEHVGDALQGQTTEGIQGSAYRQGHSVL